MQKLRPREVQASCFQFYSFIVSANFIYSIEVIVHCIFFVVLCISMLLYSVCNSFHSSHKSGSCCFFQVFLLWIKFKVLHKVFFNFFPI
jgi:hypothetical protein